MLTAETTPLTDEMLRESMETVQRLESALEGTPIGSVPYEEITEWMKAVEGVLPTFRATLAFRDAVHGAPATNGDGQPAAESSHTMSLLPATPTNGSRARKKLTKAHQIATVMNTIPAAEWDLDGIAAQMIGRGWMTEGELAMHSLQNTLSKMKKRGQLDRVRVGVYRLNPEGLKLAQG